MSNVIANALAQIALESGELSDTPADIHQEVTDLVVSEAQFVSEPTITSLVDDGAKASDVTDQLNELADRADDAAKIEDPAVADVAVESLHREFQTIMRANNLPFSASSFESSYVRDKQAAGLAADARRVAGYSAEVRKDAIGYSPEASALWAFIRRDKARLSDASATLVRANAAAARIQQQLAEKPVVISHTGSAIWLTVNNLPIFNLRKAVDDEAANLHKLHDAIVAAIGTVTAAAQAWKANPQASIDALLPASKFETLHSFATGHYLMGNRVIVAETTHASPLMKLRRNNLTPLHQGNALKAMGWAVLAAVGWSFASMFVLGIGGLVTGGLLTKLAYTAVGSQVVSKGTAALGIKSGVDNYHENQNKTDVKSAASATDLIHALATVSKFSQFTQFNFNEGSIYDALDHAHQAGGSSKTYGTFEDTLGHIGTAIDVLYEQAIYDTVEGAKLAAQVTKHF